MSSMDFLAPCPNCGHIAKFGRWGPIVPGCIFGRTRAGDRQPRHPRGQRAEPECLAGRGERSNMWKSPRWSGRAGSTTNDSARTAAMSLRPNSRRANAVNTELRESLSFQISK